MAKDPNARAVTIPAGEVELAGDLTVPEGAQGMVLFAQGSGSSRHSPRNQLSSPAAGRFRNQPRGHAMSVTGFCQGLFAQIATGGPIRAFSGVWLRVSSSRVLSRTWRMAFSATSARMRVWSSTSATGFLDTALMSEAAGYWPSWGSTGPSTA